jgi:hypothetical protein
MIHLNKLLRMSSIVLVISLAAVFGSVLFQLNFDFSLSFGYLSGLLLSGVLSLIDVSSIDLIYVLKVFALALFTFASAMVVLKAFQRKHFFAGFITLLTHGLIAGLILTSSSLFYPEYPNQEVSEVFLEPLMSAINGATLTNGQYAIFGSLSVFFLLFLLNLILMLVSFRMQPIASSLTLEASVNKNNIIAEELSRFVIPSLITPVNIVSVNSENNTIASSPSVNAPSIQENVSTEPLVSSPFVYPVTPLLQDPNYQAARVKVDDIKERIRQAIRLELEKQKDLFVEEQVPVTPPIATQTYIETKPLPEVSLNNQTSDIQNKVKDIIESQLSTLEPKTKEMVAYLINEELIKYDALNREVLETFIQEKIQATTSDAVDALRQELTGVYEERIQTLKNQQQLQSQATKDTDSVGVESTGQIPIADEVMINQWVNTAIENHPLFKGIQVPQQEVNKAFDMEQLKKDIMDSLKAEGLPHFHSDDPSVSPLPLNQETLNTLKDEIIASLKQEKNIQADGASAHQGVTDTLDKVGIIALVDDYLSQHQLLKDGFSTIIPPAITIKKARAPKNQQRADQFKTLVPLEEGLTRTGKKKIVRIPFYQRMAKAHPSITAQYDDLKNYILAFKVKSRLSNTGDTFRLHKEEFVKITLAGKALKLYLALNPKSYDDTTIPVDDVSDKKMYRDLPLMFKVKSNLSLKRAKILIDDLMKSKDLAQKAVGSIQWSLQFKQLQN